MIDFNVQNTFGKVSYIFSFLQLLLSLVGIIGNVLAILVFTRKPLRKYSYSLYCVVKAGSDAFALLYPIKNWFLFVMKMDLDSTNQFFFVY